MIDGVKRDSLHAYQTLTWSVHVYGDTTGEEPHVSVCHSQSSLDPHAERTCQGVCGG